MLNTVYHNIIIFKNWGPIAYRHIYWSDLHFNIDLLLSSFHCQYNILEIGSVLLLTQIYQLLFKVKFVYSI
jgi:hypothetical protein